MQQVTSENPCLGVHCLYSGPIASQAVQVPQEPSAVAVGPVAVFWKGSRCA